jgi:uncharacterized secreted protein with C-terminal beta-propeller domain
MNAPMTQSLYVLAGEYLAVANKLSDSDLPAEVINDTLEGLSGDLETKATNVAMFIRNLETTAEQIKLAEKTMAERRKAIENKAESIRRYLKDNMQRTGISKIECPYFALAIKKNPPSVVIDDVEAIPAEFMVTPAPPPPAPDKKAIAEKLKNGEEVPGCRLEQGERLEIK